MSTLRVPGHFSRHGSQVLGSRTLRVAPHPVWGQVRHRHLGFDARPRSQWPLPTPRHGPRPIQAGLQNLAGLPASHLARGRSWTPSTSYTSPGMLSMSAADAPGKNSTIDAGVPRIPCARPAACSTPAHACPPHANNTRSSTCSPTIATSPSRSPGASTRTLSAPTAIPTKSAVRP